MTITVKTPAAFARWSKMLSPENRRNIFAAGANALSNLVNRHLRRIAPNRHNTAHRLGARPTGHLEVRVTPHSDSDGGYILIPIPGIARAFKDLTIVPDSKPYLTLPIAAQSYGKRVDRMRQLGWRLFRPPAKGAHKTADKKYSAYQDLLMGHLPDEKPVPLYVLKKRVEQWRDSSLLPTEGEMGQAVGRAMISTMNLIAKGAA